MNPHDSVDIWMTGSHMRLCCSIIHKSNLWKPPISRLSGAHSTAVTQVRAHVGPPWPGAVASGGVFRFSFASEHGEERRKLRVYKIPATWATLQELLKRFYWSWLPVRSSFVSFVSRFLVSLVVRSISLYLTSVAIETSTFPFRIREGTDRRF